MATYFDFLISLLANDAYNRGILPQDLRTDLISTDNERLLIAPSKTLAKPPQTTSMKIGATNRI